MPKFPRNMTVKVDDLSQTFDIEKEFGVDLSDEPRLRDEIGQAIIDRIVDRSGQSKDFNNKKFTGKAAKYSDEYKDSDTFKDFNKTSKVDMELTGKMLESLDFEDDAKEIKIEVSSRETAKGYNHQYGDTVPQRAWFGMSDDEIKKIKDSFSSELQRVKDRKAPSRQSVLDLMSTEIIETQTAEATFAELFSASFPNLDLGDF